MAPKKKQLHKSHFVSRELHTELAKHVPGPKPGKATKAKVAKILNSKANTSKTTSVWNKGPNRKSEIEILKQAKVRKVAQPHKFKTDAAKRRFKEMKGRVKKMDPQLSKASPGTAKAHREFFGIKKASKKK